MSGVPWFPAWAIKFPSPLENVSLLISEIEKWRPDKRWSVISYDVAASEVHLWSAWHKSRSNEQQERMIARDPTAEFLRIISGTRQIKTAIDRSGVSNGDARAWLVRLPEIDTTGGIGEISLPVNEYNNHSRDAERLIELVGARIIPRRPFPTLEGLKKIGFLSDGVVVSTEMIEQSFLLHASMSDF
ncbi:MAG TPA: hypothetical protein HA315_05730 [Candidatus Thalassarchaeaceae archaeon]|jgi:tRNA threonylcarbamoyladenosine modification (KEOPS) complex Cgi121 subunit|nr:MAG TPA: hypothetical protein D7H72_05725 [Candidatus Poseidoniales archaeon]HII35478.1 hypothetical protein [Candidatus Thalassarchaeaceae archaeon]|tara:strand:- start:2915 stop:3475 length:561 start_codon:yes stop_codon:yes gene_type:complete